ncbi:MAG: D-amino-acid transaminase [Pseudomonadota bacterium]
MGRVSYVNGRFLPHRQALVSVEDRGYQFADGVYEVCAVLGGRFVNAERHLDRLERSLEALSIAMPRSRQSLVMLIREMIRHNRVNDGLVYVQVTRGVAKRDHKFPAPSVRPSLVLIAYGIDGAAAERTATEGVAIKTVADNRWGRCDIKSVALLANVLAKQAAREALAFEAWFVDQDGLIVEGASTSAWIVTEGGVLKTRFLDTAILPGCTRARLIDIAQKAGYRVEEQAFSVAEAQNAKEAFLTAASAFVTPVVTVDGHAVGDGRPGAIAQELRALYRKAA